MIRKLVVRTLIACAAVVGLTLIALCVAGVLAVQQPEFYTRAKAQVPAVDAEEWVRQEGAEFEQWMKNSIERQRRQTVLSDPTADRYDPNLDTHSICLTEQQLNGMFASGLKSAGDVQNPRVGLSAASLQLGVEVVLDETRLVVSTSLKPFVASDGRMHFELQSGYVGNLRIPLQTLLSLLQNEMTTISSDLELDLSGSKPVLVWNSKRDKESPIIQAVHCSDSHLEITFQAPVITQKVGFAGDGIPTRSRAL